MSEYIIRTTNMPEHIREALSVWYEIDHEIVRCRDCEHAHHYHPLDYRTGKPHETLEEWYCDWHSNAEGASEIEPDGFCAWGERRSE